MGRVPFLLTCLVCLGLTGCASMNPRNWHWPTSHQKKTRGDGDRIPPPEPPDNAAAQRTPAGNNNTPVTGVLAGQVIDGLNQRRPGAVILVSASDSPNDPPQEAAANDQGYFIIQGLNPGRHYKLSARLRQGDQTLTGTTIATPPNVVLLIKLGEDAGPDDLPPIRAGRGADSKRDPSAANGNTRGGNDKSWSPNAAPGYLYEPDKNGAERIAPTTVNPQPGGGDPKSARLGTPERNNNPRPAAPVRPDLIAEKEVAKNQPPTVEIGNGPAADNAPGKTAGRLENSRGAFCSLTSDRVLDFSLTDLNGRPFQLNELRGKVVLIDFWGTWCPHCMRGIPHLVDLQRRFGQHGLEVVGIAYEDDKLSLAQKIEKVNFVRQRQGINYKVLLGAGDDCPVLAKLDVQKFPSLILVDETGHIVWRGEGMTAQNKARLEAELRKRLRE